jgi:hypothetical protein
VLAADIEVARSIALFRILATADPVKVFEDFAVRIGPSHSRRCRSPCTAAWHPEKDRDVACADLLAVLGNTGEACRPRSLALTGAPLPSIRQAVAAIAMSPGAGPLPFNSNSEDSP